jgi:hypothetical protein
VAVARLCKLFHGIDKIPKVGYFGTTRFMRFAPVAVSIN